MNVLYRLFADVIDYRDLGNNVLIYRYNRLGVVIRKGTKIHVRKNHAAALIYYDKLMSVLIPGKYYLVPEIFTSIKKSFKKGFKSEVDIDLYLLNLNEFSNNPWSSKNPISLNDSEYPSVQIRAFGKFSFSISEPQVFMNKVFLDKRKYLTGSIILYLSTFVGKAVEDCINESGMLVSDIVKKYRNMEAQILDKLNEYGQSIGVEYTEVHIEKLSVPAMLEKLMGEKKVRNVDQNIGRRRK